MRTKPGGNVSLPFFAIFKQKVPVAFCAVEVISSSWYGTDMLEACHHIFSLGRARIQPLLLLELKPSPGRKMFWDTSSFHLKMVLPWEKKEEEEKSLKYRRLYVSAVLADVFTCSMKLRILYSLQNRSVSFQVALTTSKICKLKLRFKKCLWLSVIVETDGIVLVLAR